MQSNRPKSNRPPKLAPMDKKRTCMYCNKIFSGRIDKKYCSDACRSLYNIEQRRDKEILIKQINKILKRNREILFAMAGSAKTTYVHELDLTGKGFDYKYFTSLHQSSNGKIYYFCYDICYSKNSNNTILIVKPEV
jgi:predicted nucleic acid-binding Zn ribbon protein